MNDFDLKDEFKYKLSKLEISESFIFRIIELLKKEMMIENYITKISTISPTDVDIIDTLGHYDFSNRTLFLDLNKMYSYYLPSNLDKKSILNFYIKLYEVIYHELTHSFQKKKMFETNDPETLFLKMSTAIQNTNKDKFYISNYTLFPHEHQAIVEGVINSYELLKRCGFDYQKKTDNIINRLLLGYDISINKSPFEQLMENAHLAYSKISLDQNKELLTPYDKIALGLPIDNELMVQLAYLKEGIIKPDNVKEYLLKL